jgi:large subunit ribosomal protein L29
MRPHEIRAWTTEEIDVHLEDAERELFALRRERLMGRLEDDSRLGMVKRDIARMKTILRERELAAELMAGGEAE